MKSKHVLQKRILENTDFASLNLVIISVQKKNSICNYFLSLQIEYLTILRKTIKFLLQSSSYYILIDQYSWF